MITEKIDKYLITEMKKSKYASKLLLKAIGYKETGVECCGTCEFYQEGHCRNEKNLNIIMSGEKVRPLGLGITVDAIGICPQFEDAY